MKEREAKEAKALEMFKHLREYVGKEVTCTYWWYGEKEEETADLVELSDFAYVQIGTKDIPFVSNGVAIIEIASSNGVVLYANPYIEYAYNRMKEKEVDFFKEKVFGKRIVELEKKEREEEYKRK